MEEEEGSAATELPMCNCGSQAQYKCQQLKKTLVGDFGETKSI